MTETITDKPVATAQARGPRCAEPCPNHDHACDRDPHHLGPHRDVQQKGTENCSWEPAPDTGLCWVVVNADGTDPDDDGYSSPHLRTEDDIRHFLSGLGEHPMSQCVPKLLDKPCVTVECACGYRHDEEDEGVVIHFEDQAQADEAVKSYGWTIADGQPACPECTPQAKAAAAWNAQHPVGTLVRYWTGFREGDGKTSHTRSEATVLGGHTAVVWVDGESSCIALTHVQADTKEDR